MFPSHATLNLPHLHVYSQFVLSNYYYYLCVCVNMLFPFMAKNQRRKTFLVVDENRVHPSL